MSVRASAPSPGPLRRWVVGARPRTLVAAIVPVGVGGSVSWWAWQQSRASSVPTRVSVSLPHHPIWWHGALALVVALAIQIGTNYANDYSDGVRGTDDTRTGPPRLVSSGWAEPRSVRTAALTAFFVAGVAGIVLCASTSWWMVAVGAASIAAGWLYTGGPRPYGYLGMGEAFVFVFFGLVATMGTVYVTVGTFPAAGILAATVVGLMATALLEANNLRDISGDAVSGKRTLAVRLGRSRGGALYAGLLALGGAAVVVCAALYEPWSALVLACAPLTLRPLHLATGDEEGARLLPLLVATARLQLVAGVLLASGFLAAGAG